MKLKDEENRTANIKVSLKYVPVRMDLDPSESINNMGNLRVDVLDAADLPAADRNGKSDPYAKFELNGQEVFKTKTQKKTLNPVWNEFFEVPVPSRTAAKFTVNVYDYDFADKPDFLGAAVINLEQLDPFKAKEVRLLLDGKSGSIRLRLLFRPDYITRMRMGTGTFSGTFAVPGRIVTGVVGAPIKGVGAVGHGVGKGASFIKRGFRGKKDDEEENSLASIPSNSEIPTIVTNGPDASPKGPAPGKSLRRATGLSVDEQGSPPTAATNDSRSPRSHTRNSSVGGASLHSIAPGTPGSGTASFTVVSASGYPPSSDVYVQIRQLTPKDKVVGKTRHHESPKGTPIQYDETFKATCTPDTQFKVEVKDHHTFSSDDDLGGVMYVVDESGTGADKEIEVGSGKVVIRSSFTEAPGSAPGKDAADAKEQSPGRPGTSGSGLRRSFLSKREPRPPSSRGS